MKYANAIVAFLLRLGLPMGRQALLTVPGRKTGLPRITPVALNRAGDGWWLISVYGEVDWVKNLRAAGSAQITRRGRNTPVTVKELTPEQATPMVRDLIGSIGFIVRSVIGSQFPTDLAAPSEAWVEEARRHPTFLLTPVPTPVRRRRQKVSEGA
ncbi:MAG TPA: nitroreductase family deazaflavin-dependent oxidoreductase [Acidimicrobiia bacterium]|nr:nitroreductase family deazaflavin-dependent oxidoreductase [Acidimicrobiia bacterium]